MEYCFNCKKELKPITNRRPRKLLPRRCFDCSHGVTKLYGKDNPLWTGGTEKAKERKSEYGKRWIKENPLKARLKSKVDIARKRYSGEISISLIQEVYEDNIKHFGTLTCYLCLNPIEFGRDDLEHKIPASRGGTNEKSNLAVACDKCNSVKHNKTYEEYIVWSESKKGAVK